MCQGNCTSKKLHYKKKTRASAFILFNTILMKSNYFEFGANHQITALNVSPFHRVVVYRALGASDSVDAAIHNTHPDPVPGGVEGGSLAPLVGHGVVATQSIGLYVGLK